MFVPETEFNPDKFRLIPSVAVFKEHERVKGGRSIKVTRKDLEEIAANHNRKFKELGVAVPLSYGHTLDGDILEENQPELLGFCANFSVSKLASGEDALFGDFYLKKDKADWVLDNLPTRSVEYFPNSQRLHPIALLKTSAPELDLPVIRYSGEDAPYRYSISEPICPKENLMANPKQKYFVGPGAGPGNTDPHTEESWEESKKKSLKEMEEREAAKAKKAKEMLSGDENHSVEYEEDEEPMEGAKKELSKGAASDKSEIAELKQQMAQVMQMLSQIAPVMEQLGGLLSEEEGGDLMAPAGKSDDKPMPVGKDEDEEKEDPKAKEMDSAKKVEGPPVKFEGSMASPTNSSIPSYEKDKFMTNEEAVKYKKEVDGLRAEVAKYKAEQAKKDALLNELVKDKKAAQAKDWVRRLEEEEMVQYASEEIRQADVKFFETLDAEAARNYFDMAKVRYQKKVPVASDAVKYQHTQQVDLSGVDLLKLADEAVKKGQSAAEALATLKK